MISFPFLLSWKDKNMQKTINLKSKLYIYKFGTFCTSSLLHQKKKHYVHTSFYSEVNVLKISDDD